MSWFKRKKVKSGWSGLDNQSDDDKNQASDKSKNTWVNRKVIIDKNRRFNLKEIIVKFFIRISILLVVHPKNFENKSKKYELVNRTYERLISRDFTFIPVSTAFYFFLSFIPIIFYVQF